MIANTSLTALGSVFAQRFRRDENGNVAIIFALTLMPMLLFMGAAIDYTRGNAEHTKLQSAVDSAALSLAHEPKNTPLAVLTAKGQKYFAANFTPEDGGAVPAITVKPGLNKVVVSAETNLATSFMALGGQTNMPIGATSEVAWGRKNIELALALDNTGSMADLGKIVALRGAVNNLLTKLEAISLTPGDVKVSLIPFTTSVKVDPATFKSAPWVRWGVTKSNPYLSASQRTPPTQAQWTGCLTDREQEYDTQSVPMQSGVNALPSAYPASQCFNDGLLPMVLLTPDLEKVRDSVNKMTPLDATDITIGYVNGLSTLRPDHPLGAASSTKPNTEKFLVLLTDGHNTMNRYDGNGSDFNPGAPAIDARLKKACDQVRADGNIKVFTIRLLDGDAALLSYCAANGGQMYPVSDASQIQGVFDDILTRITGVHVAS